MTIILRKIEPIGTEVLGTFLMQSSRFDLEVLVYIIWNLINLILIWQLQRSVGWKMTINGKKFEGMGFFKFFRVLIREGKQ